MVVVPTPVTDFAELAPPPLLRVPFLPARPRPPLVALAAVVGFAPLAGLETTVVGGVTPAASAGVLPAAVS